MSTPALCVCHEDDRLPAGDLPPLIRCEGSGCPPCAQVRLDDFSRSMCAMCGHWFSPGSGTLPEHERADILAQLDRGDFG